MSIKEVTVPDVDVESVEVIEIAVQVGDQLDLEDTWIVVESDKATVEVPSPFAGTVKAISVKVGDTLQQGDLIGSMETAADVAAEADSEAASEQQQQAEGKAGDEQASKEKSAASKQASVGGADSKEISVSIPDIGGDENVEIIEVLVSQGAELKAEDTILVLESDKATMEVPCPQAGMVTQLFVKVGDKVSEGSEIIKLKVAADAAGKPAESTQDKQRPQEAPQASASQKSVSGDKAAAQANNELKTSKKVHAGPAVRRLARELGVDLGEVTGTGPKQRILKEDVHAYVKQRMTSAESKGLPAGASGLPELPEIDFSKWGEVEVTEVSKLKRVSAANLHRSWLHIPHVTQFDEADITELEAFRKAENLRLKAQGIKLTFLPFLIQAVVKTLQQFPTFAASLSNDGQQLILKKYLHIGIAVDTPQGLVVPVVKNADQKTLIELAEELVTLSSKARDRKLSPADMQGATFTISSLGGIGGTAFTPIVNWPEVAILGVSRSAQKPVFSDGTFVPRLMLPLSLSYDHRVIDGVAAARFTRYLAEVLEDIRRVLL